MSSKGGYAAAPPRQGGDRFYNPPMVRRQQILQQQSRQRQMVQQQQQHQHQQQQQQQQQKQRQLHKRERVKSDSSSSAEAEKQSDADNSSVAVALSARASVSPSSTVEVTNLDRLMESVTPFIKARYLTEALKESGVINEENIAESKVALVYGQMNEPPGARMRVGLTALTMAKYFRDVNEQDVLLFIDNIFRFVQAGTEVNAKGPRSGTPEVDSHAFFYLEDLWESFNEWSMYGAGVPLLLNGRDPIEQYYVPFLSGIQLYLDPSGLSSRLRGSTDADEADSYRLKSSAGSSDCEGDRSAKSVLDSNLQRLSRLSMRDKSASSSASSEADTASSPGSPVFQFLEYEQPHNRRPLTDKISLLTSQYPELSKCRSCDLLPMSWFCVAWYPIYRIPVGPTLQDLDASFLTFHSLSTQSRSSSPPPQLHAANTRVVGGFPDPTAKISLPVFALASYKLKGSIVSPCGPHECEQENSLLEAAENWLRCLQVMLPDYQFFRTHYSQWR